MGESLLLSSLLWSSPPAAAADDDDDSVSEDAVVMVGWLVANNDVCLFYDFELLVEMMSFETMRDEWW